MNFYIGKWDRYYHSQVIIIDGLIGETLWRKNNSFGEFTSPLTLQMKKKMINIKIVFYINNVVKQLKVFIRIVHGIGLQDGEISK